MRKILLLFFILLSINLVYGQHGYLGDGLGSYKLQQDLNGNLKSITLLYRIGIGTTTPQSALHIGCAPGAGLDCGLTFGDGDTGVRESTDDNLRYAIDDTDQIDFTSAWFRGLTTGNFAINHSGSLGSVDYSWIGDTDSGLSHLALNELGLTVGGVDVLRVSPSTITVTVDIDATGQKILASSFSVTGSEVRGQIVSQSECVELIVYNGCLNFNVEKESGTVKIENVLEFEKLFQPPKDNYPMGSVYYDTDTYKLYVSTSNENSTDGSGWRRIDYESVVQSHIEVFIDTAAVTTITQDVYTPILGDYADGLKSDDFSWSGGTVTYSGTVGKRFAVDLVICVSCDASTFCYWKAHVNGSPVQNGGKDKKAFCLNLPNNDVRSISPTLFVDLNPGDQFALWVTTNDGEDLTHDSYFLTLNEVKTQ